MAREWLVTNGLGGYACGTVAGADTRRYHAFLMASSPAGRTLLVAKVELSVEYRGSLYHLSANEFAGGAVDPQGFMHIESFAVEDGMPVWRYALADALLEQRIFMATGANASYLRVEVLRAAAPVHVVFKPLVTHRGYHDQRRGTQPFRAVAEDAGCRVQGTDEAPLMTLRLPGGRYTEGAAWYWNFLHREEYSRGLDALEDLWGPGTFAADLDQGSAAYFTAGAADLDPPPGAGVLQAHRAHALELIAGLPKAAPPWLATLAVASDQFIVRRDGKDGGAASIIAGYPWFTDWGRDTMISLPGLTTALGRFEITAAVLRTYAGYVDRGMLPNRFPDAGGTVEYNTADAALWMFQAVGEHLEARRDPELLREVFPALTAIIHAYADGTRYGIKVDPADGLLRAGERGIQLTWMDAKCGDHVFTPRIGKPVEINALWLNALDVAARLAGRVRNAAEKKYCSGLLKRAAASFARFWNEERGCLYDVLDVEGGGTHDAALRPNQIFAVALPYCVLAAERQRAVVDTCARELLTSHGLRSLAPTDPAYIGHYTGDLWQRDAAYHQGTVWSWLLGPFARAHFRVYGDAARAQQFLAPMAQHLGGACLGTISEIFDGDAPHIARGCFAQAWSVAEILRSWIHLDRQTSKP